MRVYISVDMEGIGGISHPHPTDPAESGAPAYDVSLFVGYHARAGHPTGTIAHTYSGRPVETRLDGRPTGEYGFNALVLGAWGSDDPVTAFRGFLAGNRVAGTVA